MNDKRMDYVDNFRCCIIVFVVCQHAAVTYSGLGSWFYKEPRPMGDLSLLAFALYQSFFQAFSMGALFLLAGYFAAKALDDKGPAIFAKTRMVRLGAPTLFFAVVIFPVTVFYLGSHRGDFADQWFLSFFFHYLATPLRVVGSTGPLWFALALLIFCLLYAGLRALFGAPRPPSRGAALSMRHLVRLFTAVATLAFCLRLRWPIGTAYFNMQFCFFSQYILLFWFGTALWRNDWLHDLTPDLARRCLKTVAWGFPLQLVVLTLALKLPGGLDDMYGGLNPLALGFAVWESLVGVFMSVGCIALFKTRWNSRDGRFGRLPDSAFAVYVLHTPILIVVTRLLTPLEAPQLAKFLLASLVAVPVSFLLAGSVRRLPGMNWLLKA